MKTHTLSDLLLLTALFTCAVLFSSCAKPPDVPVCEHLDRVLVADPETGHQILEPSPACLENIKEPECGHCVRIVSGEQFYVGEETLFDGQTWSEIRKTSVQVPAASYAKLAAYMINACKKTGCNEDVTKFKVRLGKLKAAQ